MTTPSCPSNPATGRLFGLGVGPGDPELITVKSLRVLQSCPVVAYFAATRRESNARRVVSGYLSADQCELRLTYPITTEAVPHGRTYDGMLAEFYDAAAAQLAEVLDRGCDVAVLCEGDPFFYGSYMYLHSRLAHRYPTEVVPGVTSILAGAAVIGEPLVSRDEELTVLSGVLPVDELEARLRRSDAAVVMKLGRNLAKVRTAIERAGLLGRAHYVERATTAEQRILPLAEVDAGSVPYFSLVVIPSDTARSR